MPSPQDPLGMTISGVHVLLLALRFRVFHLHLLCDERMPESERLCLTPQEKMRRLRHTEARHTVLSKSGAGPRYNVGFLFPGLVT